ncbi:MAG: hypothetical protein WBW48_18505 [Anaerolineae bacterium]
MDNQLLNRLLARDEGFLRQEGKKRGTRYYPTDKLKNILKNA